ncbi:hypothetical protein SK128_022745, partial [Halocaridina rubra]
WPRPKVMWYIDGFLVDDQMDNDIEKNILNQRLNRLMPLKLVSSSISFLHGPSEKSWLQVTQHNRIQNVKNRIVKSHRENLDPHYDIKNTVALGPFSRSDLKKLVTCEAINTNLTSPATATVM